MLIPEIRSCNPDDAEALALIGKATFLETFAGVLDGAAIITHCAKVHSADLYRMQLLDSGYNFWSAEIAPGGAPVGFAMLAKPDLPIPNTSHDLELKRIYLLSKFHGGGIGKQLLSAAIECARAKGAKRLLLGVYGGNTKAQGFYKSRGFKQVGSRTFVVGGVGYDDNIMALSLND
jgi:ribosomal protein S18 acetylase RimI-like enzyme